MTHSSTPESPGADEALRRLQAIDYFHAIRDLGFEKDQLGAGSRRLGLIQPEMFRRKHVLISLKTELVPAAHHVLTMARNPRAVGLSHIETIKARMPTPYYFREAINAEGDYEPVKEVTPVWNDIFLELISDDPEQAPANYLLNSYSLDQYSSASDLVRNPNHDQTGDLFMVAVAENFGEASASSVYLTPQQLETIFTDYSLELQSSV